MATVRLGLIAAYKGKTVKQWLLRLNRARLAEMEKKGISPPKKDCFFD